MARGSTCRTGRAGRGQPDAGASVPGRCGRPGWRRARAAAPAARRAPAAPPDGPLQTKGIVLVLAAAPGARRRLALAAAYRSGRPYRGRRRWRRPPMQRARPPARPTWPPGAEPVPQSTRQARYTVGRRAARLRVRRWLSGQARASVRQSAWLHTWPRSTSRARSCAVPPSHHMMDRGGHCGRHT
jgi:hypothetical protein